MGRGADAPEPAVLSRPQSAFRYNTVAPALEAAERPSRRPARNAARMNSDWTMRVKKPSTLRLP